MSDFDLLAGRAIAAVEPYVSPYHDEGDIEYEPDYVDLVLDDGTRVRIAGSGYEYDGLSASTVTDEQRQREREDFERQRARHIERVAESKAIAAAEAKRKADALAWAEANLTPYEFDCWYDWTYLPGRPTTFDILKDAFMPSIAADMNRQLFGPGPLHIEVTTGS